MACDARADQLRPLAEGALVSHAMAAGLSGLAGGNVVVPVLTWFYGAEVLQTAVTVSWFCVCFNSLGAAVGQWRTRSRGDYAVLLSCVRWYFAGLCLITLRLPLLPLSREVHRRVLGAYSRHECSGRDRCRERR